jgi:hypothetical protein
MQLKVQRTEPHEYHYLQKTYESGSYWVYSNSAEVGIHRKNGQYCQLTEEGFLIFSPTIHPASGM